MEEFNGNPATVPLAVFNVIDPALNNEALIAKLKIKPTPSACEAYPVARVTWPSACEYKPFAVTASPCCKLWLW